MSAGACKLNACVPTSDENAPRVPRSTLNMMRTGMFGENGVFCENELM
jgi:hypothetical protein